MKSISFKDIKGGEAIEYIDSQIQKIVDNINDPNTEATKKRKLTVSIEFVPDATRDMVIFNVEAKRSVAPDLGVTASVYVQQSGGVPYIVEQMNIEGLVNAVKGDVKKLRRVGED